MIITVLVLAFIIGVLAAALPGLQGDPHRHPRRHRHHVSRRAIGARAGGRAMSGYWARPRPQAGIKEGATIAALGEARRTSRRCSIRSRRACGGSGPPGLRSPTWPSSFFTRRADVA